MDLNKKNMKRIALLIAFGLLLYWGLNHPGQAGQMLSTVFSIFLPFLLGGCLAFLLNVILRPVERGWRRAWGKRYGPRQKRAQRPVCLLVSTLLLVGVVFAIFFIVVPALKDSVVNFVSLLPSRLAHLEHWWNNLAGFLEAHSIQLPEFSLNSAELQNNITSFLSKYGEDFLNTTIGITSSIFSLVVNLVLALAFSLYLLSQKETLTGQAKKVVRALFSEKWAHWITDVARMTNRTFSNFVTGQLTEAVILGTLCFLGMLIDHGAGHQNGHHSRRHQNHQDGTPGDQKIGAGLLHPATLPGKQVGDQNGGHPQGQPGAPAHHRDKQGTQHHPTQELGHKPGHKHREHLGGGIQGDEIPRHGLAQGLERRHLLGGDAVAPHVQADENTGNADGRDQQGAEQGPLPGRAVALA